MVNLQMLSSFSTMLTKAGLCVDERFVLNFL